MAKLRREYRQSGLSRKNLNLNPFMQFEQWIGQAINAKLDMPNSMSLATTDFDKVSIRTVLLKSFDERGFVFFTNYNSKKSQQIEYNPKVALLFSWLELERQVEISGVVEKITTLESAQYFASRAKNSQLGAWASKQSSALPSRQVLLSEFNAIKTRFGKGEVPLPDFWGGYRVLPEQIEFWQGRADRLHDRFVYTSQQGKWVISRLAP